MTVLVDMPNALSRSNFQRRGKSVAASVPSDSSNPSEVRKRITKHERRAMVVSFVNKYQATNAGKFPSAFLTRKQIGGSHYVIREILQELEYKSKFSPLKETQDFPLDKVKEDIYISSDARQEPSLKKTEGSISIPVESCILNESNTEAGSSEDIINIKGDKTPTDDTEAYEVSGDASTTFSAISSSRNLEVEKLPVDTMVSIGSHGAQTKCTQDQPKSFSVKPDGCRGDRDDLNDTEQKDSQELSGSKDLRR
ncbi:hypothetical protein Taro_044480 [Colocasia esculenta]|uniref:AT3G52170-like helix-turn-helix domain-containing protein n=1 Tax=Colocasia esculenta TaxID=4460 RepID=A0A843WYE8_COLES|nr:hypothetical protein [Colocasia esculenta]